MEEFKNEVVRSIRSCLISTKGKITLRQLEDDYRTLLGERIPYHKLGHKSLELFIQSVPSLITSRGPNGEMFVDAQVSEKTAHISSMVQKQKTAAPKKKVRITQAPRFNRAVTQPPPNTTKWRPKRNPYVGAPRKTYQQSSRLSAVSHNQFVSGGGYARPRVPSKVVVPERSEFNTVKHHSPPKELTRHNSSPDKMVSDTNGSTTIDDECSPLSSTMRRISKIMSGISMERDSGNSSPTTEFASNYKIVQEFAKTGDPIQDIRNFAAYHKLGDVEVKFTETRLKKSKVAHCHCKITVGQHKYSSYPEDFYDKAASERHACQKALDDLMTKYSKRKSLLLSSNDDIIERIPPMLEKHNNAVWMWQIEADYIDMYNEQLPADWLQVIDNNPHVSIEKCLGGYVLKHCNPDDKGKKLEISLNVGDVSVPCNTVNFGENNRLYALITAAHSCYEVWCQQCGTPEYERFLRLTEKMEVFYNNHQGELVSPVITLGSCYVIQQDGGWIRARALSLPHDGFVDCFLIDYGEEIHIPIETMYVMKREFALEQAQAFVCRLAGLEEVGEASADSEHLTALVGREFVVEIIPEESSSDEIAIPVVVYDITTGASINEELISLLTVESAVPVLDKSGVTDVYVSNIESNGDVYVQVRNFGYTCLMDLLKSISDSIIKNPPLDLLIPRPTPGTSRDRLYLVKCNVTQRWLRATIIDWSPKGDLAQIYFLDIGNTQVVSVANDRMYPLDKLSEVLCQYPPQAVKVRFMIEKIPSDFVQRAEKLLPSDERVLLKISSYDNENVAWVEFFKRMSDGVLVFINKSISVEAELQSFSSDVCGSNETRKRLMNLVQFGDATKTVPSGGSLKKPDLPKMGDYFNVNIPFAVNPWNFFVQPLDSFNELTALMADMQEYYKDLQFSPVPIEDIVPGKIYASKHEDGKWYRTSVLKVIHSGSISVFYCDFGYYTNLTLAQLVPLDAKYMSFPYQALKAKIAGIKPIKNKWTMEDCDIFNSLVTKKQFVSILVNIEKDELYKSDIVLLLLLIDTSSEEDINIKEVLIARGIATSV
ncbi:tudor domain-containing protein 7 isoform X2 [Zophobas morio]|uniref:tudor domain-containing protein 7 isoform X2 n=1 Tax=Zophobas morio TaxID=2755281 RepID=UPI0030839F63